MRGQRYPEHQIPVDLMVAIIVDALVQHVYSV